ncbi:MAG: MFS transporter [Promethearchaeota archaeon]|jgi:DHA3 family macrolide efflux protein-like MFS transporter
METSATNYTFRNYLFFWGGQLVSLLGSSIIQFVIIWWIAEGTGSPIIVSVAFFLGSLPMVIVPLIIGVFIDRWNRKLTIAITDSLQAFFTFLLILFFITDAANIWLVMGINFLRGVCQSIHFPTVNAIIPLMIPKKHLSRMNGINYLFTGIIRVIGPIVAGFLLLIFDIQQILWVDVVTFFIAIIPLFLIKIPSIVGKSIQSDKKSYFKDFKSGLTILKTVKALMILIMFISVINLLNMPFTTQMSLYIIINHSGGEQNYAMVAAFLQGGIVIGAIIALSKKNWKHKELIILYSVVIGVAGYSLTALAPEGNFLMIGFGALIHASMIPIANTMFLTILQTSVPPETQGRVFSIVASIAAAVTPLGMLISGPLAVVFGIRLLFIISLCFQLVTLVLTWFLTSLKSILKDQKEGASTEIQEELI